MGDLGRTTEPLVTMSAVVVRGKKSNRVKLGRQPRASRAVQVRAGAAGRAAKGHARGARRAYVVIGVSLYADDLVAIDAAADRAQMNRSRFLVAAAKHFAAFTAESTEADHG